jgi:hypothetical protein
MRQSELSILPSKNSTGVELIQHKENIRTDAHNTAPLLGMHTRFMHLPACSI